MPQVPWWKNSRGELFVLGQFVLFVLIIFGPQTVDALPAWSGPWQRLGHDTGALLMTAGALLALAGVRSLGRNLTPFICPRAQSIFLERGAYGLVRHPIYSGLLQMAFGWAFWVHGWFSFVWALCLFLVFDSKSRREEQHLIRIFPGYAAYSRRVRRLIPLVY